MLLQRRHVVWLALLAGVSGAAWLVLRAGLILQTGLAPGLEGVDLRAEGVVASIPDRRARRVRFEFRVEALRAADGRMLAAPARVRLADYGPEQAYRAGERWRLMVRLKRPHGYLNPGGFDYEGWLFQRRIRATGYVRPDPGNRRLGVAGDPFARLGALRERLGDRVARDVGDDPRGGILVALLTGDRAGISEAQWEVLRRTGTGHLVAISGLHVGLVATLAYLLTGRLWAMTGVAPLRLAAPRAAALGAIAGAAGYSALAGFSVPTQRALVMVLVAMSALVADRRWRPSQILAVALLAVLGVDPLAPMSAGFWLSFGAVAVILYGVAGRMRPQRAAWRWVPLQGRIALGLAPLLMWHFGQVPLVSPLANLLAVPVVGFVVVPLVLAGGALELASPPAAGWLLSAASWVLGLLWPVLETASRFPPALLPAPAPWALAAALAGLAWLLAPPGTPARWIGAVCCLPALLAASPAPGPGEFEFVQLDVGQGLSAVVRTQRHALVYDAGPAYPGGFDAGRHVVVPYLRQQRVRKVDRLVVSHGDQDHIGGVPALRQAFAPGSLLTSVPARLRGAVPCRAGQEWEWDKVRFSVLHPVAGELSADNDSSCVLRVEGTHGSVLLAGDIEAQAEAALVDRVGPALRADVLLAPHHGSRTSSTPPFIDAVRPRFAIFAAGYRSRYGHPHRDVVQRYLDAGAGLYRSAQHGAIRVTVSNEGVRVSGHRELNRRYWHDP
jgi:competence protein ComEC